MKSRTTEISPQVYARVVGLLYLITIITGITAEMVISGKLVVAGDAAATATNILTHKTQFRLGFTVYLIEMACQIAQMILFYVLLKPVSRNIALLGLFFGLTGSTIKLLGRLFFISPLLVLENADYLSVFSVDQLQALALLLLNINSQAAGMALGFFGISDLLNGSLILRSSFLPRVLGVLSILGGLGWLTFLYPPLGIQLFSYILFVALLGSAAQILWLLFKGVDAEKWHEASRLQASNA